MKETLEEIKNSIAEYCRATESIEVQETTDSAGNPCLEWRTTIILELFGSQGRRGKEERLSRQSIPVQFDISFDIKRAKVLAFLQWGRIEQSAWSEAEKEVQEELAKEGNAAIRYYTDREVVELCLINPFHEFDFTFVYEEVVSFFGIVNGIVFKNANNKS